MKNSIKLNSCVLAIASIVFLFSPFILKAQDTEKTNAKKVEKPVRDPWGAETFIETQTSVVYAPKTFVFTIQHRFGKLGSGTFDLAGLYAPSNIRIGLNYTVYKNLEIGIGTTKDNKLQDFNWKYAILKQTRSGSMPIDLTYFGNMQFDARESKSFGAEYQFSNRMAYFNQLIISRKFAKVVSIQASFNYAHYNQIDSTLTPNLDHDNVGFGVAGRVKVFQQISVMLEYEQPLTTPDYIKPNFSIGVELGTSGHAFQIFVTNYHEISYAKNLMFNTNDFFGGDIFIGFNITRNWNF